MRCDDWPLRLSRGPVSCVFSHDTHALTAHAGRLYECSGSVIGHTDRWNGNGDRDSEEREGKVFFSAVYGANVHVTVKL